MKINITKVELAEKLLERYDLGVSSIVALYISQSSESKTLLNKDLVTAAKRKGYKYVLYINCSNGIRPILKYLSSTFRALPVDLQEKGNRLISLWRHTSGSSREDIFISIPDALSVFEVLFEDTKPSSVLLIVDEVQDLLDNTIANEDALYSLRAFYNRNSDWLHMIMAGSDRERMNNVFRSRQSPFYGHSYVYDLQL